MVEALKLHRRPHRRRLGRTLVEGPHLLGAAVAAGAATETVFGLADDVTAAELAARAGADWIPVEPHVLRRVAPTAHPRGPVAVVKTPPPGTVRRDCLVLAVTDPGNLGTLIRSAAAFGLDVVVEPNSADPWSPKALRAGAGAHFSTVIATSTPPGLGRIATVVTGGADPGGFTELLQPGRWWAVLVGAEAQGLPGEAVATADLTVTIPTEESVESLNASVAGSLVAYELARWRRAVGTAFGPD